MQRVIVTQVITQEEANTKGIKDAVKHQMFMRAATMLRDSDWCKMEEYGDYPPGPDWGRMVNFRMTMYVLPREEVRLLKLLMEQLHTGVSYSHRKVFEQINVLLFGPPREPEAGTTNLHP